MNISSLTFFFQEKQLLVSTVSCSIPTIAVFHQHWLFQKFSQ